MTNNSTGTQRYYTIAIEEHLDKQWQEWFDGVTIEQTPEGHTVLCGTIQDQAALHGLLRKINNLGLTLLSVNSTSY
ncbi:MAG: hypothetical protein AAF702_45895 [Chloroflexota bacterium]